MNGDGIVLDGQGPLHLQIRRAIAGPILSGAWAPGRRIPSEHELVARFGVSRMTVNRALASLAGEGLVERRRRAGTVVAARSAERAVFEIWDIAAEIARAGGVHRADLLARAEEPAGAEEAALLKVEPGTAVLRLVLRHHADGVPVQLEERLVDPAMAPAIRTETFAGITPGRWLLERVPWTEAEHRIGAVEAPAAAARHLGLSRGAACLVVERRTWRGERAITHVRLTSPAGAQVLVGRFGPSAG
ncbi:histidine utilization repressor [Salinarimonas soli]|uniref:Histidine utilization repressor n=1 Tax=Salinarimonas soli TaxID=1638099 RepID=A0A5B2VYB2_9HYPH|nr:histidine utilization repressor [Salinarimonas soli]KAA2244381.1 histidine utilization repressor [Salinarimonas soli]